MIKKLLIGVLGIIMLYSIYYAFSNRPDYYDPERNYLNQENEFLRRFIMAKDSSIIDLPEGHFIFSKPLSLSGLTNVTIKGKGMDKTILSFKDQKQGAEGLRIDQCTSIVLEDFTVEDAAGDNIKVQETDGITFRRIKAAWTGKIGTENGAYGLYPVLCKNVLIEECEVLGSSDAGIYVGQSEEVIIRNNIAHKNVAGIESENSKYVKIYGNQAYDNTGGILVFDLPGLTTYGHTIEVYDNLIYNNNRKNFAMKGAIVGNIPAGTGMLVLATEKVLIRDNGIKDHKTLGIGIVSYDLVYGIESNKEEILVDASGGVRSVTDFRKDKEYDPYPSEIKIQNNQFENNNWLPNLSSDFGKLFLIKNGGKIPDVVYDGIFPENRGIPQICIEQTNIKYLSLDAGNDFENLSKEIDNSICGE